MKKLLLVAALLSSTLFGLDLSFKDTMMSGTLKLIVSAYLSSNGFGKVEKLELDTNKKSLSASTLLEGEDKPLTLNISRYDLVSEKQQANASCPCMKPEEKEAHYLVLKGLTTNRAWLNNMNKKFFQEVKVPISADKLFLFKTVL